MTRLAKMRSLMYAAFLLLILPTAAISAQYSLNGYALGGRVQFNSANYKSYKCDESSFESLIECNRTRNQNTSLGTSTISDILIHSKDGTAVYLMASLSLLALDENLVRKEINNLSKDFGQQPTMFNWLPEKAGTPKSVIVTWGDLELRPLYPEDYGSPDDITSSDNIDPIWPGLFLDPLGDRERSRKAGLPIYRITGGPAFIYSASFDETGRGHRRLDAIDILVRSSENLI
jgi:hypothetical protein